MSTEDTLNVGVIGLGTMGKIHLEALSNIPNVSLGGVSALTQSKIENIAAKYETQPFFNSEELIKQEGIDIIDLCVPTDLHKKYITLAAKSGKHIICEKPLGLDLEEANELKEICQEHGVKLFVGHVVRFFPEYVNAREEVKNGIIGNPGVVRIKRGGPFPRGRNNWYADESKSGGLIFNLIIHDLDWLRWTFGEVERVMTLRTTYSDEKDNLEYVLSTLRLEDGTIVHIEGTWAHTTFQTTFEITGESGMITHDSDVSFPLELNLRSSEADDAGVVVPESPLFVNPYQRQLAHFVECIQLDKEPIITPNDAIKAVEIASAVAQSAKLGKPVELSSIK